MSELKPCPFCGGEAREHAAFAHGAADRVGVYVECDGCGACSPTCWGEEAQRKASEAWNSRARHACRTKLNWSDPEDGCSYDCSACGDSFGMLYGELNYCPCCGARVVEK